MRLIILNIIIIIIKIKVSYRIKVNEKSKSMKKIERRDVSLYAYYMNQLSAK